MIDKKSEISSANNILMIAYTHYYSDPRVMREAEACIEAGYNVDFISLNKSLNREQFEDKVKHFYINIKRYRGDGSIAYLKSYMNFFVRAFWLCTKLFFKKKYKVVHINNMPDFFVFIPLIPKIFGSKIILDIHDPIPFTYLTKFNKGTKSKVYKILLFIEIISAKFANLVITVSEPVKLDILVMDGIKKDKIKVITNFADENLFQSIDNYKINGVIKLIFHGTIAERFGLDNIVNSFNNIKNKNDYVLTIIGEGDYSSKLIDLIEKKNLQKYIRFENHFYPVKELPKIISNYHIGIASYTLSYATNYMLPVKMLEYISCGIPVITVKNKVIEHYFGDNDLLFFNPEEDDSLTKLFDYISDNRDTLYYLHEKIAKEIAPKYRWGEEKIKYLDLINVLLKN